MIIMGMAIEFNIRWYLCCNICIKKWGMQKNLAGNASNYGSIIYAMFVIRNSKYPIMNSQTL